MAKVKLTRKERIKKWWTKKLTWKTYLLAGILIVAIWVLV